MTFRVCSKHMKFAGILAVIVTSSTLQCKLFNNGKTLQTDYNVYTGFDTGPQLRRG